MGSQFETKKAPIWGPSSCAGMARQRRRAVGYPMVNVRDIESGRVRAMRQLFGDD